MKGKTILLHNEQGFGDTLQFCRYAKLISDLGGHVILEAQKSLAPLLANLDGVSEIVIWGSPLPEFDYHCALLSLPWAFKTNIDTIPAPRRYIDSDATKVSQWRARLGEKTKPRVGLTWSGNSAQKNDHNRSIPLADFLAMLPDGFEYVSLQKDVRARDREVLACRPDILTFGDSLLDFSDTAALCEHMDVVVTVCTSTAHLAAAMGKLTWILLSFNPCWRWLLTRPDNPWYPSAVLYRQERAGDWSGVFMRVKSDLTGLREKK